MKPLNIAVLGVSELKWDIQPGHYKIFYSENDKLRRNRVALILRQDVAQAVRGYNAGDARDTQITSVRLLGKPINITVIQVYAPTTEER